MNLDLSQAKLQKLHIHLIGSNTKEELVIAKNEVKLNLPEELLLKSFLFNSVDIKRYFTFTHEINDARNDISYLIDELKTEELSFYDFSVHLANKLYKHSNHANINLGECFIGLFDHVILDGETVQAIGVFKSDAPSDFVLTEEVEGEILPLFGRGTKLDKTDKAALIFLNEGIKKICINSRVTHLSKYWYDDFLDVKPLEDEYYYTSNYLDMVKDFALNKQEDDRANQVDLLNRSVDFFKAHESFDEEEFQNTVLREPEVKDAFEEHRQGFTEEHQLEAFQGQFEISNHAVKNAKRRFRSVIKLDKNFHLYVHGKRDMIEKGYDSSKGLSYYKLYFEDES
ncbi:MAG: nucleoid-associated protein [Cyclobacteriaceae bacterium]